MASPLRPLTKVRRLDGLDEQPNDPPLWDLRLLIDYEGSLCSQEYKRAGLRADLTWKAHGLGLNG